MAPHSELTTLSRNQQAWDIALAAACVATTLVVNLSGSESVPANSEPGVLSVGLTVVAVGIIALRRRFPLAVLLVALLGVLGLVLTKGTVGLATLGPFIAFYTAVAIGSRQQTKAAIGLVAGALALTTVVRPVDLSREGAAVNLAVFAGALLMGISARTRRERFAAVVLAAEQRAELERERATQSATQERLRITRELHDVIGHAMSVMVVQAGVAERLLDSDPQRARTAVGEIASTGRRSLAEMRQVLGVLRDESSGESTPRGPAPTLLDLPALAARVEGAGLRVRVHTSGVREELPSGVDLAAYRVVQEALTNCLRHSGATCADVRVLYASDHLEVEVVDDGQAVDPPSPPGQGLAGLRERVAIHGGALLTGTQPSGGFRVHATLPLSPVVPA
ncbi:putative two component sensor kinase [metagenome]|uniref:histidine kinase n=1 Tax=metagenome TaxID=256318 RepID=A0A2P2BXL1_9ZZZZ